MQPACVPLPIRIIQGVTFSYAVRIGQPIYVYRPIQAIEAVAPVRLRVDGHGLSGDWPVWVRSVQRWPEINREPRSGKAWQAKRVDADKLEINVLSAVGQSPVGGELVYQPPVDLTGCSARMRLREEAGGTVLLELEDGAGLELDSAGVVRIELTPEQTVALSQSAKHFDLDITFADGEVRRYVEGPVKVSP